MVDPIVSQEWFAEHREEVILADVRWYMDGSSGLAAFERAHIPGAVYVDLDTWLAAPASEAEGRHPLPAPEVFAEGMAVSGISDGDVVVAYDDAGGVIAARLVWMLRATGHQAALLDGGLGAYRLPLASGSEPVPARGSFAAREFERVAGIDDAVAPDTVVIDARPRERYSGDVETIDARPGHIPGALNVPCRENLQGDGTFLPVEDLRRRFTDVGIGPDTEVVSYCGSGVTAAHNALALEQLGLGRVRLYPGSWSQYAATDRPAALG
ncbi:thiosulfate/3-mercaptopyruvate sulfurtransferase [Motilibacter peucedani]|uniref:Thiosulfate/3-mercaptopyruvate sulfurtransferase n=1 Tax=Motilibacter peucedani TaxID=598650 RepID=A0A420XKL7_9ACTN|nr:sulfurtransferase [Motilibacter peucedani]RKS69182.1 thiosulfate/3-mercaptopyruvate sulfurtransferase [Motilibacter peucedani]